MSPERLKTTLGYFAKGAPRRLCPATQVHACGSDIAGFHVQRHLAWMAQQAVAFVDEGRIEKANRWLGFIQGVSWMTGRYTLSELRKMNKGAGR